MSKHIGKRTWIPGLIILSLLVFTTVLAQKWVQKPQSNTSQNLNGVWVTATKNIGDPMHPALKIFAVGNSGVIITSANGTDWTAQTSTTANHLNAIWGSSATDVFAVGENGTILHSANGTDWTAQTSTTANHLNAIWGSSATDVFAVGENGTILHSSNGTTWTAQTSGTPYNLNAVWGISSDDVYAVGDHGTILHYNGTAWSSRSIGASISLKGVWGASPCNIYAVGELEGTAVIYHYDGSSWTRQDDGTSDYALKAVHGASIRDIFAVGESGTVTGFDPEDATAPVVCSSQPGIYDVVPVTAKASAAFNAVMDPTTINSETFTLVYYDGQAPHQVEGTVTYSNNTATFTPSNNLAEARTYHATLKAPSEEHPEGGVRDNLGVPLSADYTWTFTVWSDQDSDSGGGGCFIAVSRPAW